jgi:type IV pilus assembly protein PilM
MIIDRIRAGLRRQGKPAEDAAAAPPSPAPPLWTRMAQLTWVKELRGVANLVARRQRPCMYGVDVGSSSVKIMRLSEEAGRLTVTALAAADLPAHAIVDGEVSDREAVVGTIVQAMAEQGLGPGLGVAGVGGRAVIVKRITMEKTDPDLARETLSYDAAEHIPFEPGEVCLDLHVLEAPPEADTMDVLLVAAKRPVVELQSQILKEAGLTPAVIDVDTFALANAYLASTEAAPGENVALVNLGHYVTNLVVLKGNVPWVMRDLTHGVRSFEERVEQVLQVESARAHDVLFGSPERGDAVLPDVVTEIGGELLGEIERSLVFADSATGEGVLTRMVLSGGGGRISGLSEFLSDRMRIPVVRADPFRNLGWGEEVLLEKNPEEVSSRFMIATGLALRGVRY